jgi:hypothetical protein
MFPTFSDKVYSVDRESISPYFPPMVANLVNSFYESTRAIRGCRNDNNTVMASFLQILLARNEYHLAGHDMPESTMTKVLWRRFEA